MKEQKIEIVHILENHFPPFVIVSYFVISQIRKTNMEAHSEAIIINNNLYKSSLYHLDKKPVVHLQRNMWTAHNQMQILLSARPSLITCCPKTTGDISEQITALVLYSQQWMHLGSAQASQVFLDHKSRDCLKSTVHLEMCPGKRKEKVKDNWKKT